MNQPHQLEFLPEKKENKKNNVARITTQFDPSLAVNLFLGDRIDLLKQIKASGHVVDLVVTSPPYNTGKEYEVKTSLEDYVEEQRKTIVSAVDILAPTGSICWQVGHYIQGSGKNKEAFPLDLILYPIFKEHGLKLRNRIVWTFGHGLHEAFRFTGRHETILWFTRNTDKFTFNLDPIRVPQKYPGKRAYRGTRRGEPSGNPKGKNPSDVWDIPNVKANHIEKTEHPCQFPVGLIERLVLGLTNEGDLVVDPYMGVGTTAIASYLHARRAAGADIYEEYLQVAMNRIEQAADGTLKTRPMNQPVHTPTGQESVSKVPEEWLGSKR
jgi:adenine-specific DNA-methyltransferase